MDGATSAEPYENIRVYPQLFPVTFSSGQANSQNQTRALLVKSLLAQNAPELIAAGKTGQLKNIALLGERTISVRIRSILLRLKAPLHRLGKH